MFAAPKPKKGEEEQPPPPKIDVLAQVSHASIPSPPPRSLPLLTPHTQAPKHLLEQMQRDALKSSTGVDRRTAELPVNPDER